MVRNGLDLLDTGGGTTAIMAASPTPITPEGHVLPMLVLVFLAALGAPSGREQRQGAGPAVSGIQARLFHNKSGQLSDDMLGPQYRGGWNTIAGPDASNATVVIVEVSGIRPEAAGSKYSVKLVARERGRSARLLLTSTVRVPPSNEQGKTYVPFLIHQTGCSAVQLTATLISGQKPGKPAERTLPFACGE
jgi:hypothetical protein